VLASWQALTPEAGSIMTSSAPTSGSVPASADQITSCIQALSEPTASVSEQGWPEGRPSDWATLMTQSEQMAQALDQEEARLAQLSSRSFWQKAVNYFQNEWPEIWSGLRKKKSYWAIQVGVLAFFMLTGAVLTGDKRSWSMAGAIGGFMFALLYEAMAFALIISRPDDEYSLRLSLRSIEARQQALAPWLPSLVELRVWRSVPEVHAQVAALMTSPIGLRQGDRPAIEARLRDILAQDQTQEALTQFVQDASAHSDLIPVSSAVS
jgi:hypothetical protein